MIRTLVLAASLLLAAPAFADPPEPLLGRWTFETAPHPNSGCIIAGTADFTPGVAPRALTVVIEAEERCPRSAQRARVTERCGAVRVDADVQIRCRLVRSNSPDYVPDHFQLRLDSPYSMSGRLDDERAWNVPVRFERPGEGALIS